MITRTIDINSSWNFGKGIQDYYQDKEALPQNIKTRLMSFLNDCFFDLDSGVDWFFFLGSKNINGLKVSIAKVIADTVGVVSLNELSLDIDDARQMTLQYEVTTVWSEKISGTTTLG
jgi:hypothetical protein